MTSNASGTYELRVEGHLEDQGRTWLADFTINRLPDGTSTLVGPVADQSQLHDVLDGLAGAGARLLSLRVLDAAHAAATATTDSPARPVLKEPVHTERLTLRPATPQDADATWRYRRLGSVGQWLTAVPTDLQEYRARFAASGYAITIVAEHNGQLIGDFMLRVENAWAQAEVADRARATQAELGWVLDPGHVGYGYATEAVRALLRVCFEDLGLHRVVAVCFVDNEASWRLMERVGMRREAYAVAESLHRSGRWLDTVSYAILAEEWKRGVD